MEEATATVLVALDHRDTAQQALDEAAGEVGRALTALTALDVSVERAALLVDLPVRDVRRLVRLGAAAGMQDQPVSAPPGRVAGSGVAASRAG